jgi:hypothetical protein
VTLPWQFSSSALCQVFSPAKQDQLFFVVVFGLNICMQDYIATIRIKGTMIKTVVHAQNPTHARLMLQYQYGMDNIVASPVLAETLKPKTPEQLRLDSLKANKDRAADALAAERQRQKVAKAQAALSVARQSKPPSVQ